MSCKIFVGNLSYETTQTQLQELLGEVGEIKDVYLPADRISGRPRGFAFVEFSTEEEAKQAIEKFNEHDLGGRKLRINEAEDRPRRAPGGPRPGGFQPSYGDDNSGGGGGGTRPPGRPKGSRRGMRGKKRSLYVLQLPTDNPGLVGELRWFVVLRSDILDIRMAIHGVLQLRSLREQVYEYLRDAINRGELHAGSYLDQKQLSESLGISKTPLRDALIQLETEGFVSILPRRGVVVNELGLDDIRHIYEIVGALEGVALVSVAGLVGTAARQQMRALNAEMMAAVEAGDFDTYYSRNLAFHNVFLGLSKNTSLVRTVENLKHRLYDFPRRERFVAEWESSSTREHAAYLDLLERGDIRGAADYLRDVHWSFEVQEPFILRYYFPDQADGKGRA